MINSKSFRSLLLSSLAAISFACAAAQGNAQAAAPEKLFYMVDTNKGFASLSAHIDKIDMLVPAWYRTDKDGLVSGAADERVLAIAAQHHVPVAPIIGSTGRADFHAFLGDAKAQSEMINRLLAESAVHHYVGFQLDFENIIWTDRDALSAFVRKAAAAFHAHKLQLSIAVCPNAPGHSGSTDYGIWMWQYWRGVYDLKALGDATDFISLMTYDQNTRWTAPGPVGGWNWMVENVDYALKFVPKDKISLGIPLYGYHWFAGNPIHKDGTEGPNISGDYIDADESLPLAKRYNATIQWDAQAHEAFFWFERDMMREWVFMPNPRSTKERYDYAKLRGLRGTSAWVLGAEDPEIWSLLPADHG